MRKNQVSSWCISRRSDGTICIAKSSENDHSIHGGLRIGNRKDIAALQKRIDRLSEELRHILGDDPQVIRSMLSRIRRAEEFLNDSGGTPTSVDRMQELVGKIKEIETTVAQLVGLQNTVAGLHIKMQNVEDSSEAWKSHLCTSVSSAIRKVEESIATISGNNEELSMRLNKLSTDIRLVEAELVQLQQTARSLANLKDTADDLQLQVHKVEGGLRATDASVKQLDQGISEVKDDLQKLYGGVDQNASTVDSKKIHEAQKQLARQVGGVERSLTTVGKTLHSLNAKVEEVTSVNEARTVAIELKVSGTQNALQTMGTRINSTITSVEATAGNLSTLHSQVHEVTGRMTATETRMKRIDEHIGAIEGETRKVGGELKSTNATVLKTQSDMSKISGRVSVVEQTVQGVHAKFTELEAKENRLQAEVAKAANTKVWHANYWK